MRRFYEKAEVAQRADGSHAILLDGRPVRTPARGELALSGAALAQAIAAEWQAQGDDIVPATMKLTGIANAAIDLAQADPAGFAAPLAAYGGSDLFCYRAPEDDLAARQAAEWNPLLDWAERRYGVEFTLASGVMPVTQPPATVAALGAALAEHHHFRLAALSPVISIGGSLIAALAMAEGAFNADRLWQAVTLDERWQEERWGEDADAIAAREARHADWQASARFLALLAG